jgi:hypothetical protein
VQFDPHFTAAPSRLPHRPGPVLKFSAPASSIGAMRCFRQASVVIVLGILCSVVTGCAIPRDIPLSERCADVMRRAYPSAAIEITKSEASPTSLTTIVARVEGVRNDMPPGGPLPRDLAVECRFDQNVLTGFRWTAGPLS